MKAVYAMAATAAVVGASNVHHRHAHDIFHGMDKKGDAVESCGCTTHTKTFYGEPTLYIPPPPPAPTTTTPPPQTSEPPVYVPTPVPHTCPTPGTYTFPATTVTLTESTTVCVPTSTPLPSGTHTYGGVTTVVTTATTLTCPYPTVSTTDGVETSVVETTTYVCPSEGTYTIAPTTTVCDSDTTVTYPAVTEYPPGTYTAPEVVTTVVDTNTVVYCPFDTPTPVPLPEPTTEAPAPPPTTTAEPEPEPTTVYPTTTDTPPKPEPTHSEPEPTHSKPSTPKPQPSGGLGGTTPGKPWGTTFTPYKPNGDCMSQAEVEKDVAALALGGIKVLRTYSTDCSTLEFVGNACEKHGVQMMVGVYIDQPGCSSMDPSISEQINSIASWAKWDLVPAVVVGNEAGLNGFCTPQQLAGLVSQVRSQLGGAGYKGLYTTADTVNIWQQDDYAAALCPVVDVVGANAHAFFDLATAASEAGTFVKGQLDIINNICSGKEGIVLETGWPRKGHSTGLAIAGVAEQALAIHSIVKEVGEKAILFSLFDDTWKDPNTPCGCEQYFGCADVLGINISW